MTTPTLIVTQSFTDAAEALAHAATIYDSGIAHLRRSLQDFVAGQTPTERVRAHYPFVRVRTDTVARADSRLSYGFVAGPGVYETTLTRPDLFADYYREQFHLLLRNHGGPLEVGMSRQPIPRESSVNVSAAMASVVASPRAAHVTRSCRTVSPISGAALKPPILHWRAIGGARVGCGNFGRDELRALTLPARRTPTPGRSLTEGPGVRFVLQRSWRDAGGRPGRRR